MKSLEEASQLCIEDNIRRLADELEFALSEVKDKVSTLTDSQLPEVNKII